MGFLCCRMWANATFRVFSSSPGQAELASHHPSDLGGSGVAKSHDPQTCQRFFSSLRREIMPVDISIVVGSDQIHSRFIGSCRVRRDATQILACGSAPNSRRAETVKTGGPQSRRHDRACMSSPGVLKDPEA